MDQVFPGLVASDHLKQIMALCEQPRVSRTTQNETLIALAKSSNRQKQGNAQRSGHMTKTLKVTISLHESKAMKAGFTTLDIEKSIQPVFAGIKILSSNVTENRVCLSLSLNQGMIPELDQLEHLNIFSLTRGAIIPMKQIARVIMEEEQVTV